MKISFISTVFNEEENISSFIKSVLSQTKKPDEIIIVDGGSSDQTVANIKYQISNIKNKKILERIKFKLFIKSGNRSVGRNEAIKNTTGDIILCSDAGCVLDKIWVEKITEPFKNKKVDVVAGYYKGKPRSVFEKCLIPYVLVMPDKVNPNIFLPATRSMAFRKSIWKNVGGFPEQFSHNEDYVFAQKLKKIKAKIVFAKDAIVYWLPRKNIIDSFNMFYRFAFGDSESKIIRPKVILLFFRYLIGVFILMLYFIFGSYFILYTLYFILISYILWSIAKNYKYVKHWKAIFYLPLIQFTSDIAVTHGTIEGLLNSLKRKYYFFL